MNSESIQKKSSNKRTLVVVVDDQGVMRSAIRRILDKEDDFESVEFSNGTDAIAYLKSNPVDLILTDIFMPKGDGFSILTYIRNRSMANDLPVVFVSGEATKNDIVHAIDEGATDYILKPFEPNDLLTKLRNVRDRYANPTEKERDLRQAESSFIGGLTDEAEQLFLKIIENDAKSHKALAGLAQVETRRDNLEKAAGYLKQAIEINGLYFPAYALLADLFFSQGDKEEAKGFLLKELSINGKQPHRRKLLAEIYRDQGDIDKATDEIRKALLDSPRDEALLLTMGDLCYRSGNTDKAIHYYIRTRKNHPQSTAALEGIAQVCEAAGIPQKAIGLFTDILRISPAHRDTLFVRAKVYEKMGSLELALADLEAYLAGDSEALDALKASARILGKLSRPSESLPIWKQILKLAPCAEHYSRVGLNNLRLGNYQEAAKYYERATSLAPQNPTFHFNLGFSYESLKCFEKARICYKSVLELTPGNADAQAALLRVESMLRPISPASPPAAKQPNPDVISRKKTS